MTENKSKDQSKRSEAPRRGGSSNRQQGSKNYSPHYKRNPEEIPVLRYGAANNFHKFKEALSKAALREYGLVGKLIDLEKRYEPDVPTRATYQLTADAADNETLFHEAVKGYTKINLEMSMKEPMLYAMIWQYLSPESMDEIKHDEDYKKFSDANDPEGLWKAIIKTHKVTTVSRVKGVIKRSARKQYQAIRQGGYESLISYRERFDAALTAYKDQDNPDMEETDIALDFFDGLDNGRYAQFKADIYNGMAAESIDAPADVNTVYKLAHQWVKTQTIQKGSSAATFVTSVDDFQEKPDKSKKEHKVHATRDGGREDKKQEKLKQVKCYNCLETGHYANKCPHAKKSPSNKVEDDSNKELANAHVTWHAATFLTIREVTVNNAVNTSNKLKRNQVLLDNQADVSIIHPALLTHIKKAGHELKINGVGGEQLKVEDTGYLPDFFEVYSSERTQANVLCFADVEDKYNITYIPQEGFVVHLHDRDITFRRDGKLYIAEWELDSDEDEYGVVMATVKENEAQYTRREVERAKEAFEFVKNAGYPSEDEAIHLIEDGNLVDVPSLTRNDIKRAFNIYGQHVESVRGKMTQRVVKREHIDETLKGEEKEQRLYSDVMQIDTKKISHHSM